MSHLFIERINKQTHHPGVCMNLPRALQRIHEHKFAEAPPLIALIDSQTSQANAGNGAW